MTGIAPEINQRGTRPKSLYVTYDGLLDPLGRSQIVGYVLGLRDKGIAWSILSFEKPAQLHSADYHALRRKLAAKEIHWRALRYHKAPSILATAYDVMQGVAAAGFLITRQGITIVHARSYVAALIAWVVKRLTGVRFIFDMRGLWADERVDGHWWRRDGILFKVTKACERWFLRDADRIVVLTRALKELLLEFPVLKGRSPDEIAVIPTCVDLERFTRTAHQAEGVPIPPNRFVYVYFGSIGTLYLLPEMVEFFQEAAARNPASFFLVLANGPAEAAENVFRRCGMAPSDYAIQHVPYEDVGAYLSAAQASLFFIKPCYSKVGSYPTKCGESLAAGLPVVTNRGCVDMDALIEQHRVGVVIDELTREAYRDALDRLEALMRDPGLPARCRQVAAECLSLERGISAYQHVYSAVLSGAADQAPVLVET